MPTRLATKGDMTSRWVSSVVFKTPKCTSHHGIGLDSRAAADGAASDMSQRGFQFSTPLIELRQGIVPICGGEDRFPYGHGRRVVATEQGHVQNMAVRSYRHIPVC